MIHEGAFYTSTIYPFSYMIFQLCGDARVTISHCDTLRTLVGAVDIGLIMYEANVAASQRGPRVELQLPS